jgi:sedoheptulose-bisphosphatase
MDSSIASGDLLKVYNGILESVKDIADHLRYNTSNKIATANDFGDVQLDMDVQTDSLIFEALRNTGVVWAGLSEERAYITQLCDEGNFIVTFDPLDGSSIVDTNFTIGSIFAIWPKGDLTTMTGRDIVGGALALYGSRTNVLVFNANKECIDELTLQNVSGDQYAWIVSDKNVRIRPTGKYFSPGNTRSI